jgi:hypothetical protein
MPDTTPHSPVDDTDDPDAGKPKHFIRHVEEVRPGLWEVSTLTEDGHRLGGVGRTQEEAIEDAHQSA